MIQIDEKETGTAFGQNIRKLFPEADLFVSSTERMDDQLERFVSLFFGKPVITPSRDEMGMFYAQAAAMKTAALGRQVGAAIMTRDGEIVATGCNEVAKCGGGPYWDGDAHDGRDFRLNADQSDVAKTNVLRELLYQLQASMYLSPSAHVPDILNKIFIDSDASNMLADLAAANLTEFTRDVHAETEAIVAAARLGISVNDRVMYVTTFPCHNCAKHIVGSGISRVVFREPYPKSYAKDFYADSIEVDGTKCDRVPFLPFIGVAPRNYMQWFAMRARKRAGGIVEPWTPTAAVSLSSRMGADPGLHFREMWAIESLQAGKPGPLASPSADASRDDGSS